VVLLISAFQVARITDNFFLVVVGSELRALWTF
jgi:hypothetical protein